MLLFGCITENDITKQCRLIVFAQWMQQP